MLFIWHVFLSLVRVVIAHVVIARVVIALTVIVRVVIVRYRIEHTWIIELLDDKIKSIEQGKWHDYCVISPVCYRIPATRRHDSSLILSSRISRSWR